MEDEMGHISDGYHTFNELYEHRHSLFLIILQIFHKTAFKTKKDSEGQSINGYFIAGLETPSGQITYHIPDILWDKLYFIKEINNYKFDGHTSKDVLGRLGKLLLLPDLRNKNYI